MKRRIRLNLKPNFSQIPRDRKVLCKMGSNPRVTEVPPHKKDTAERRLSTASSRANPPEALDVLFLPAGSFASQHCSTLLSESGCDQSCKEDTEARWTADDPSRSFLPTRENVIIFETLSPVESLKDERGGEDTRASGVSKFSQTLNPRQSSCTPHSLGSSLRTFQTGFLKAIAEGQDMAEIPEATTEGSRLGDTTSERKRDEGLIWKELEELRSNCRRYESQNEALRHELQCCTLDLQSLDRCKKQAISENSLLRSQLSAAFALLSPLSTRLSTLLGTSNPLVQGLEDLCELIGEQVERVLGGVGRLRNVNEGLTEENKALKEEVERLKGRIDESGTMVTTLHIKESQLKGSGRLKGDFSPNHKKKESPTKASVTPYNTPATSFIGKENRRPRRVLDPSMVKGGTGSSSEAEEYSTMIEQSRRPLLDACRDLQGPTHTRSRSIKDQSAEPKPREEKSKAR